MYVPVLEYPKGIEQVSQSFVDILSESQVEYFKKYLTGLMCSVNKTITGINRLFVFDRRNQSSFNRFFTASPWAMSEVNRGRLELLQSEPHTRKKKTGVVIIDDTHNEKYGQQFEMIAKLYDHSKGYYHWAHNLVTAHYSDEKTDYPLGFRTYSQMDVEQALSYLDAAKVDYDQKKLQSYRPSIQRTKIWKLFEKHRVEHPFLDKNDLACQLIDEAFDNGYTAAVVFDSWFTVPKVLNHIEQKGDGYYYVGQLKANRKVLVSDEWQHISDWAKQLVQDHQNREHPKYQKVFRETSFYFKGIKKTYWAFSKVIRISKLNRKRVVISFKTAELKGDPKFFVSNNKQGNAAKILSIGRHRWPVEPFYEISKGSLGLDKYELRDFVGIQKHWTLVFLAYSIVKLQNPDCIMRCGDDIQTTFGDGLKELQKEVLTALFAYCYECGEQGISYDELMKQLFPAS
jgi:hypothetical protein